MRGAHLCQVAQKILAYLGLPTRGPQCAPARATPDPDFDFDVDLDDDDSEDDGADEVELID